MFGTQHQLQLNHRHVSTVHFANGLFYETLLRQGNQVACNGKWNIMIELLKLLDTGPDLQQSLDIQQTKGMVGTGWFWLVFDQNYQ